MKQKIKRFAIYLSFSLVLLITIFYNLAEDSFHQTTQAVITQARLNFGKLVPPTGKYAAKHKSPSAWKATECSLRPLIFLKGKKVAATAISSMLSAYAVSSGREHVTFDQLLTRNESWCGIIAIIEFPSPETGQTLMNVARKRGEDPAIVLSVREPVQRSLSTLKHSILIATQRKLTDLSFIFKNDYVIPPHFLLNRNTNLASYMVDFKNVFVLESESLDESLLILSKSLGIKTCYFLYSKCEELDQLYRWTILRCRDSEQRLQVDQYTLKIATINSRRSGEFDFYVNSMYKFGQLAQQTLTDGEIREFKLLREEAASNCQRHDIMQQTLKFVQNSDKVFINLLSEYRLIDYVDQQIDVTALCMQQWACQQQQFV